MAPDELPIGEDHGDQPNGPIVDLEKIGLVLEGQGSEEMRVCIAAELADVGSPLRNLLASLEEIDAALWDEKESPKP